MVKAVKKPQKRFATKDYKFLEIELHLLKLEKKGIAEFKSKIEYIFSPQFKFVFGSLI